MKLAEVSIRRPVLATVMVGVLAVFGLFAYPKIGVDLFPEVEFPIVTVTAVYPGADPETVESRVVDKLEEAISTTSGIKFMRSTSAENVGLVVIQFELERKADQAVQDVRDKVAAATANLPSDLEAPLVEKLDIGAAPVLSIAVSGKLPPRELTRLADDVIKERLQSLRGVGGIDLIGAQARELHVWLDPQKLEARGVAPGEVVAALRAQNVEIPGGRLDVGQRELIVKTRGQVKSARELGQIILHAHGGASVRVSDVARVEDGAEEKRSHSSLSGDFAVALVVRKQSGANTVAVAHVVKDALEALKPQLPAGVKIAVPMDNSSFIEHAIGDVQFDLLFGAGLAVLIILFFLRDLRATFISALAIPTSILATLAFIQAMGFTFNNMTMLALSLSIGILVDDAIVVIENIHRHLETGAPPREAAARATAEIGLAVLATTASIIAVFVPVATMRGLLGRFFLQFGLTVAFAVAVSLFVAFTLTPMLSSRLLSASHGKPGALSRAIDAMLGLFERVLGGTLRWALAHRAATLGIALLSFAASFVVARWVPFEFIPPEDRSLFMVRADLPTGTALDVTRGTGEAVAAQIRALPGVTDTFLTIGGGAQGEVNRADIQVQLVPKGRRAFSQLQAMEHVRHMFAARRDALFSIEQVDAVGGSSAFRQAMVQFNVRGKDYAELNEDAAKLMALMVKSGGYVDLDTTFRGGKPELAVTIDRDRAADLGIPVATIAMTLRTLLAGEKATEVTTGGERLDVRVRLGDEFRRRPEDLLAQRVRTQSGALVRLSEVVTIGEGTGPAKIERQNRQRQVTILANLQGKALGDAVTEMETWAKASVRPSHQSDWAGFGDIMKESIGHMGAALLLAIVMVYLILAAQFESFIHPLTIMMSLPLSLVGALLGLAIARQSLNIFSMIGVIMLMGLVTKNAILLVDHANHLRAQGTSRNDALVRAGIVRLRPILMTTSAMIFGMIPVALALSEGGEQRAPMAVVVIGGLITSTMLTLVVVPVVYALLDGLAERVTRKRRVAVA